MNMKFEKEIHVIPADKFTWSKFERTKCGPEVERQDACNNRVSFESLKLQRSEFNEIPAYAGMTIKWTAMRSSGQRWDGVM
jgi:hypothetical protein